MENLNKNEIEYIVAKERVRQLKKFYISLFIFALVLVIYGAGKYYKTYEFNFSEWDNWSAIFWIWGIILLLKGMKLFFFNQNWERRMMDKQLNK